MFKKRKLFYNSFLFQSIRYHIIVQVKTVVFTFFRKKYSIMNLHFTKMFSTIIFPYLDIKNKG